MNRVKKQVVLGLVGILLAACGRPIVFEDEWMDSPKTRDPARLDPTFLVSTRFPDPTRDRLATPVIIAGHGWSATSFEFFDFNDHLEATGADVLLSRVSLGGHGTDVDDWSVATWEDWQAPLVREYNALRRLGYEKIYMVTTSTSGTLALQALADGLYDDEGPDGYYMIAPLVVPMNKDVFQCWWAGGLINSSEASVDLVDRETGEVVHSEFTEAEKAIYYVNLPAGAICELAAVSNTFQTTLRRGIPIPEGVKVKAVRSDLENAVDPVSFDLLEAGLSGDDITFETGEGRFHVFTRLVGRGDLLDEETARALETFDDILAFVQD